jgi:hypothetical protein
VKLCAHRSERFCSYTEVPEFFAYVALAIMSLKEEVSKVYDRALRVVLKNYKNSVDVIQLHFCLDHGHLQQHSFPFSIH